MILIGSKRIQEDPGLFSLRFTGRDTGSLCLWEREARVAVDNFLFLLLEFPRRIPHSKRKSSILA
jgi:hypothetical protein